MVQAMSISLFDYKRLLIHHWPVEWQNAMDAYLNSLFSKSQSRVTVDAFAGHLAAFFACHGSAVKYPTQYTRQDVEAFLARPGPRGQPIKPATRNVRLGVLSSFYGFVAAYTVTGPQGRPMPLFNQASPTAGIHHVKEAKRYRQFDDESLRRFFAALPDRNTPLGALYFSLFSFYFYSCRRRSELLRLQWQDIQPATFDGGRVGKTYRWVGKGKAGEYAQGELPMHIYESIVSYLKITGRWDSMQPTSYVFVGVGPYKGGKPFDRTRPITGESVIQMLKTTCVRAGLDPKRFCVHSFRHTGSRIRYSLSHDPVAVMKHLDHKSLQHTFTYLETLTTQEDKQAADVYAKYRDL